MDYDPTRLKYIVHNLIGNAIRHTPEGGAILVSIKPGPNEQQAQLIVSDTGCGIEANDLPHIFDRYYQGKTGRQEQYHFGLGLAFVKDVVTLLGGQIEVSSQPGEGARFTITLPVTRQAASAEQSAGAANGKTPNPTQKQNLRRSPGLTERPRLLVVEDNLHISEYLELCLHPHFQLTFAIDGNQGLELALHQIPDLILTDVMMPGMDGHELIRRLKSNDLSSHIPIVLLSAKSDRTDRLAGQRLGANAYLSKPFDEKELILTLQNLYRLQQEWRKQYAAIAASPDPIGQLTERQAEIATNPEQAADPFLLKLYTLFEKFYPDEKYNLQLLCRDRRTFRVCFPKPLRARLRVLRIRFTGTPVSQIPRFFVRP